MQPILIVEDYAANRELLQAVLESESYEVVGVENGDQALAAIAVQLPSLILLDVKLSGPLSGLDLCRMLKADERTRPIPIIIQSAMSQSRDRTAGYQAGADDYIVKPFYAEDLLDKIAALLTAAAQAASLASSD
jgi:DNA-binding response OmpR family regulator